MSHGTPPNPQQESSGEKLRLSLSHTFPREAPVHWKSSVPFDEPTVGLRGSRVYVRVWGESGDVDERYHPAPWDQYPFYVTGTRREVNGRRSCLSHPESPRIGAGPPAQTLVGSAPWRRRALGRTWREPKTV